MKNFPKVVTVGVSDFSRRSDWTVRVRYSRPLRFRLWLAVKLTHVVAWLAGGSVDEQEEELP